MFVAQVCGAWNHGYLSFPLLALCMVWIIYIEQALLLWSEKENKHKDMLILHSKGKQNQTPRSIFFSSELAFMKQASSIICEYEKD